MAIEFNDRSKNKPSSPEQPELGGIDWSKQIMRGPSRDDLPHGYTDREYRDATYDDMAYTHGRRFGDVDSTPLFHLSDKYKYTEQQKTEVATAAARASKVADARELPKHIEILHGGLNKDQPSGYPWHHDVSIHDMRRTDTHVGHISWDPRSGEIGIEQVDEPYRQYVPHMMDAARKWADKTGMGMALPTHSNSLSDYSYRQMKKHTPSFIPEHASVSGLPIEAAGPAGLIELHRAKEHMNQLHAEVSAIPHPVDDTPDNESGEMDKRHQSVMKNYYAKVMKNLNDATTAHSAGRFREVTDHIFDAKRHLQGYMDFLNKRAISAHIDMRREDGERFHDLHNQVEYLHNALDVGATEGPSYVSKEGW